MLSNLTQRERTLLIVVLALLPAAGLFALWFWVSNSWRAHAAQVRGLQTEITDAQSLQLDGLMASQRRAMYRRLSLSSRQDVAKAQYQGWLVHAAESAGFSGVRAVPQTQAPIRVPGGGEVGTQFTYTLNGQGNLAQLVDFLFRFHSLPVLHRMTNLQVTPILEQDLRGTGTERLRLTGRLMLSITIEAIGMIDADEQPRQLIEATPLPLERRLDGYVQTIVGRNIFGLPNNPPRWRTASSRNVEFGDSIAISLTADDDDEGDLLTFELIDSPVEGVRLRQNRSLDRFATLEAPQLEIGRYTFRVRVTDSGFPPKSDEMDFTLEVTPKRQVAETRPAPPPPRIHQAPQTYVTAVTQDRQGRETVWIHIRMTGQLMQLTVGEQFRLDDHTWTVAGIAGRTVQLDSNGNRMTFNVGASLDRPQASIRLAERPTSGDGFPDDDDP